MVTQSTHSLKQEHRRQAQKIRALQMQVREKRRQMAIAQARYQKLDREMDAAIAGAG
jgi:hypothetical protein